MNYLRIPFVGGSPPGEMTALEGIAMSKIRIPVSNLPRGVPGFVRWVKATYPQVYRGYNGRIANLAVTRMGFALPGTEVGIAAADKPSLANTILSTVKDLIPTALQTYQQSKLFDLQLSRAKQNLAPYDTAALENMSAIRVGVDSQTRNTGLLIVGGVAAAFLGYKLLSR